MKDDDKITMEFTRVEWRLIAICCATLRASAVIGGLVMVPMAKQLGLKIAERTGKP